MSNRSMTSARKNKNDEFYTQLGDIENEMRHYKPHFKDKVIYMNTDHPDKSNFWVFFKLQFNHLKPKKIISTFYNEEGESFKTEYDGVEEVRTPLKGDGDFRSDECIAILKESDVIVTNPPFSLFREFINLIMKNNKNFIVLGNNNAITYKEIFPLIRDNKMWLGMQDNVTMEFEVPDEYYLNESGRMDNNGRKYLKVSAITWFTNLDYPKRHEDMLLWASYEGSEHDYPKYDNYDAINVNRVANIPYDYEGLMGVPISFIGKWNPEQFEIVGVAKTPLCFDNFYEAQPNDYYINTKMISPNGRLSNVASVNDAVLRVDYKPEGTYYIADNVDGYLIATYARVLIRNKKPRKTLIPEDDI